MSALETLSIAASAFSIALAVFAIWLAFQQRRESQANYDQTRTVLADIGRVMEKTEVLVSDNFQNLLKSITDQQNRLVESLAPKPTSQDKYSDLFIKLADEPEKLIRVTEAIARITSGRQPASAAEVVTQLKQLAEK